MIPAAKPLTRNHLSCSKTSLKLTYIKVALHKYFPGSTLGLHGRVYNAATQRGRGV